jgi:hypothetical protein
VARSHGQGITHGDRAGVKVAGRARRQHGAWHGGRVCWLGGLLGRARRVRWGCSAYREACCWVERMPATVQTLMLWQLDQVYHLAKKDVMNRRPLGKERCEDWKIVGKLQLGRLTMTIGAV